MIFHDFTTETTEIAENFYSVLCCLGVSAVKDFQ